MATDSFKFNMQIKKKNVVCIQMHPCKLCLLKMGSPEDNLHTHCLHGLFFKVRIKKPHKDQYIHAYGIKPKTTQYVYLHLCIYMFRIFALNFLTKILVVLLICKHLFYLTRSIFDLVTDLMLGKGRIMQATHGGQAKGESGQQC